eukprot:scaffold32596_cov22-Cyclotella_meneghiniana.AAC.2
MLVKCEDPGLSYLCLKIRHNELGKVNVLTIHIEGHEYMKRVEELICTVPKEEDRISMLSQSIR